MSYERINKPTARRMFMHGYTIKVLPCKVSESVLTGVPHDYDWIKPVDISPIIVGNESFRFDRFVREFEYYNCNAELGYYAHYYVDKKELDEFRTKRKRFIS